MNVGCAATSARRVLVLAIGAHGFVVQVVLLRELLAVFGGSEVSAVLLLGAWVAGEAIGAWATGRLVTDARALLSVLASVSAMVGVLAVPAVVLGRVLFRAVAGESMSIVSMAAVAAIVVLLPALTHGALFVLGTVLLTDGSPGAGIGSGYVLEGAGTALAAVLTWLLFLAGLPGVRLVAGFGIPLVFLAGLTGGWSGGKRKQASKKAMVIGALMCGLLVAALVWAGPVERWGWESMWPGQRVVEVEESPYGKTIRMDREGQTTILYDGMMWHNVPVQDRLFVEELTYLPLLVSSMPRRVLLVGGIGLVTEVMRAPVERLTLVQLDRKPFDAALRADSGLYRAVHDSRFRLQSSDPVQFLNTAGDSFDCIIVSDLMPASLAGSRIFSSEFYHLCRRRLVQDGVLALPGPGSAGQLLPETRHLLELRLATLRAVFPHVAVVLADFPLFLASGRELAIVPETLALRLRSAGLALGGLSPEYLARLLDPFRQEQFRRGIAPSRSERSTATRPAELFWAMVAQTRSSSPWFSRVYKTVGKVQPVHLAIMAGLVFGVLIAGAKLRGVRFSRPAGVATSGFAGMVITTVAVFAYQMRFGSLYSGVGLLLASFMVGSVAGGIVGTRAIRTGSGQLQFLVAEIGLIVLPVLLLVLARIGPRAGFFAVLLLAGAAVGIQFPIAGARAASAGSGAGLLLGLDLGGGFAGAFAAALVLVPVAGLDAAGVAAVVVKSTSLVGQLCCRAFHD